MLGSKWRTPTKDEWEELCKNCNWTLCSPGSTNYYYKVESKKNGNVIYLPIHTGELNPIQLWYYMSKDLKDTMNNWVLLIEYDRVTGNGWSTQIGTELRTTNQLIRPVTEY